MFKTVLTIATLATLATVAFYMIENDTQVLSQEKFSPEILSQWSAWKDLHGKSYGSTEETYKIATFSKNVEKVNGHNAKLGRSYQQEVNQFADLSTEEFKAMYQNFNVNQKPAAEATNDFEGVVAPKTVDWRTKGAVSPVKDQGQCGSCWAFSTVGGLEGASAIFGSGLKTFSEQQLVDCSTSFGNNGCGGGLMDDGFQYVIENGITSESAYPYKAVDQTCKTNGGDFKISKFTDVKKSNPAALRAAVAQQVVSIAVDANNFQFYSGGVFDDCGDSLDHGVTLVGYNAESWFVKNSWNTSWGEAGYIRLKMGNTCGLTLSASYPTL